MNAYYHYYGLLVLAGARRELVRGVSYLALIVIPVKFFPHLAHIVIPLKNASACI
jgi:hypothetical protein